jgi:hypothetical protein
MVDRQAVNPQPRTLSAPLAALLCEKQLHLNMDSRPCYHCRLLAASLTAAGVTIDDARAASLAAKIDAALRTLDLTSADQVRGADKLRRAMLAIEENARG